MNGGRHPPAIRGAIMPVTELNHYLIRANDLERTKDFYVDVLGFEIMPRPTFPFPGYWLGINGKIQVHMGQAGVPNSELYYLGSPKNAAKNNSGVVDHIAFLATDPGTFVQRFKELGIKARPRSFPEFELFQLFLQDPDGLMIELNFFGIKQAPPEWGGEDYSKMPQAQPKAKSKKVKATQQ
jgi:catechol 2,3-dioxygenase-like lactoylglutathione lyase family enzyme